MKVHKQSEIVHISDTLQVPRMVGTSNDQPFDLPCPCAPYGALVAYGVVGGGGGHGELKLNFNRPLHHQIVPLYNQLPMSTCRVSLGLPGI